MAIPISLKRCAQLFLGRIGLYQRVKSSFLYDLYWSVAGKQLIQDRRKEVQFYRQTLTGFKKGYPIFDVGANKGQKTDIFLRLGARVVAVEPDPANQKILKKSFLDYRLKRRPVTIIGKAVSDRSGKAVFLIDEPGSAKNTLNQKWVDTLRSDPSRFGKTLAFEEHREVETITLEQLMRSYGRPYYVKIDVEGHELSVLRGMKTAVPFLSFEVNLPEFRSEAEECIKMLDQLASGGDFNQTPDCSRGFVFEEWMSSSAALDVLKLSTETCVEVFWRAPASRL
jgi:FkbM family methyltransferase